MVGIYKITNKLNKKSYIGQSIDIARRWEEHIYENKNTAIHLAIQKYGVKNFSFEIIEECEKQELDEKEIYWINYYDTYYNGYNCDLGGHTHHRIDYEKIYNTFLQVNNLAQTARIHNLSESGVRAILRTYDINLSQLQENKPVEQIDMNTLEVIKTFDSITAAADSLHLTRDAVGSAARGKNNSCAGYYWRFVGDTEKQFSKSTKKWSQKVEQIDKDTDTVIATFNSMADAAEAVGKDRKNGGSMICAVCRGRKKTAFGYKWQSI